VAAIGQQLHDKAYLVFLQQRLDGAHEDGAFVERSGCKRAQVTATSAAAKAAQLLANRSL